MMGLIMIGVCDGLIDGLGKSTGQHGLVMGISGVNDGANSDGAYCRFRHLYYGAGN